MKTMTILGAPGGAPSGASQCGTDSSRVRAILPGNPGYPRGVSVTAMCSPIRLPLLPRYDGGRNRQSAPSGQGGRIFEGVASVRERSSKLAAATGIVKAVGVLFRGLLPSIAAAAQRAGEVGRALLVEGLAPLLAVGRHLDQQIVDQVLHVAGLGRSAGRRSGPRTPSRVRSIAPAPLLCRNLVARNCRECLETRRNP